MTLAKSAAPVEHYIGLTPEVLPSIGPTQPPVRTSRLRVDSNIGRRLRVANDSGSAFQDRVGGLLVRVKAGSVDPVVIGRMDEAIGDIEAVTITADGTLVGRHIWSWVAAATVIDPDQVTAVTDRAG